MGQSSEEFDVYDGEIAVTRLCVDVTVYWRGSSFDHVDSIRRFYDRALAEIADEVKFFRTGSMSSAKKVRADTLKMVPRWFSDPKRRPDMYMMSLECGSRPDELSDRGLRLVADEEDEEPVGALQLYLPVSFISDGASRLLGLTGELVSEGSFESGHAGYSLNWDHLGEHAFDATAKMFDVSRRYLGVDLFDLDATLFSMRTTHPSALKCVNWLTILGNSLTERVGGSQELSKQLGDDCEVREVPGATIIRAGAAPTTGDRKLQKELVPYRRVGKVLAEFRIRDHGPMFDSPGEPSIDPTSRWLGRFDE